MSVFPFGVGENFFFFFLNSSASKLIYIFFIGTYEDIFLLLWYSLEHWNNGGKDFSLKSWVYLILPNFDKSLVFVVSLLFLSDTLKKKVSWWCLKMFILKKFFPMCIHA